VKLVLDLTQLVLQRNPKDFDHVVEILTKVLEVQVALNLCSAGDTLFHH